VVDRREKFGARRLKMFGYFSLKIIFFQYNRLSIQKRLKLILGLLKIVSLRMIQLMMQLQLKRCLAKEINPKMRRIYLS